MQTLTQSLTQAKAHSYSSTQWSLRDLRRQSLRCRRCCCCYCCWCSDDAREI